MDKPRDGKGSVNPEWTTAPTSVRPNALMAINAMGRLRAKLAAFRDDPEIDGDVAIAESMCGDDIDLNNDVADLLNVFTDIEDHAERGDYCAWHQLEIDYAKVTNECE